MYDVARRHDSGMRMVAVVSLFGGLSTVSMDEAVGSSSAWAVVVGLHAGRMLW